jgi:hypothetical protein
MVAFVAEVPLRGKSELINAIFFCRLWSPHHAQRWLRTTDVPG